MKRASYKQYEVSPNGGSIPRQTLHNRAKVARTVDILEDEEQINDKVEQTPINFSNNFEATPTEHQRTRLYDNSDISIEESALLIIGFIKKYQLTHHGQDDLLRLIQLHLPSCTRFPTSRYHLRKHLKFSYEDSESFSYCDRCESWTTGSCSSCSDCGYKGSGELVTFNPSVIIERLLHCDRVSQNLEKNLLIRNSTTNHPAKYSALGLQNMDFCCILNTDGLPAFKSSNTSVWPLLISVYELSPVHKRNSIQPLGVWVSSSKPPVNKIIRMIQPALKKLAEVPVKWKSGENCYSSFVYFPLLSCDSVARPLCQGIMQFNGNYGCNWCLQQGESFSLVQRKKGSWIYKPLSPPAPLRTQANFVDHLKILRTSMSGGAELNSFGVKFASALLLLPKFDIIEAFVYDFMHGALLGVTKFLTCCWFNSKNHRSPFYLGKLIKTVDEKIKCIHLPKNLDRNLASITERAHWKATQWKTWMFLAPVILEGYLPASYISNFFKFSESIFTLCKPSATQGELTLAQNNLTSFVEEIPTLYGYQSCTYNIHILLHATQCVVNWGNLTIYSNFDFENYNGKIHGLFNGSHKVATQIRNSVLEVSQLTTMEHQFSNSAAETLYQSLITPGKLKKFSKVSKTGVVLYGSPVNVKLSKMELLAAEKAGVRTKFCTTYKSMRLKGLYYKPYSSTLGKRCDFVVKTSESIMVLLKIIETEDGGLYALTSQLQVNKVKANGYFYRVSSYSLESIVAIELASIVISEFIIIYKADRIDCLVEIPNSSERE